MNFLQKKLWIAWSKHRFLKLPPERRVRLEVTTDGRHITFLLVSLYEAGYGVQVVGSPAVFRELICLRKSAPIPFVIGGRERECGISITDNAEKAKNENAEKLKILDARWSKALILDYDYFSVLTTNCTNGHEKKTDLTTIEHQGERENRKLGKAEGRATESWPQRGEASGTMQVIEQRQVGPKGDGAGATESKIDAGLRLASQANASEPDSLTSKLAHAPISESLIRAASDPPSSPATSHSPLVTALRAPYFMHPSVYHRGLHKRRSPSTAFDALCSTLDSATKQRRRFRIGFFGTHDRDFYTQHYHFPGMNRFEILEVFLQKFGNRITPLQGEPMGWRPCEIAVSMDSRGGDRDEKSFLAQEYYFQALRGCDFVLSPPGWCMPVSHNLIEAMYCGAIPITNGGVFMAEPLKDGKTCLEFQDKQGLTSGIERALAMNPDKVARMRLAVWDYYERFLGPKAFAQELVCYESGRVLVNAEENSVPLVFPGMVFPWDVTADTMQT